MSGIFDAYLSGGARAFYGGHFAQAEDRRNAVAHAARPLAPRIADALDAQNASLVASAARDANLTALREGAAAVVTGQQMGLFLGPLFTLYKAASAVSAARALTKETGQVVVPVFWLQTEDHDLPEIAECWFPRSDETPIVLRVPSSSEDRTSVAHCVLPVEIDDCIATLRSETESWPHAEEHLARLVRHYRQGAGWAEAFGGLLAEFFADDGLILLNPREFEFAQAAAPIHRRALESAEEISAALTDRVRDLEVAGFQATVHVRPGAPLSFFHPEGSGGPRYRLEPRGEALAEVGGSRVHPREDLLQALAADPLSFSASALLRPIIQDTILPTAAYVGGPAEVAYFAQIQPLYRYFELTMPLVVPRARVRIIEEKTARLLSHLGIAADDCTRAESELLLACGDSSSTADNAASLAETLLKPFDVALESVRAAIESVGPGVHAAVEKTRSTVSMAVSKLVAKVEHARLHADEKLVHDVRRVKQLLFPNNMPQERCYGISYFASRYGERAFVEAVLAAIVPFDATPIDLRLGAEAVPASSVIEKEIA